MKVGPVFAGLLPKQFFRRNKFRIELSGLALPANGATDAERAKMGRERIHRLNLELKQI